MKSSALLNLAIGASSTTASWFGRSTTNDGVVRMPLRKSAVGPRPWQHEKFMQASEHKPPSLNVTEFWAGYTYLVDMDLGTPKQKNTVIFDTGSEELWVNPSCNNTLDETSIQACTGFGHYRPGHSSTSKDLKEEFGIIYGSGSAYGRYWQDDVHIGGIKLDKPKFGVNNDSIGMVAGIMGSGFGKGYRLNYSNLIDEMKDQGIIKKRQFSVVLNHWGDAEGEVIFGGIDTKKYSGKLHKAKVLDPLQGDEQRYLVNMTSIGMSLEDNSTHHHHHASNFSKKGCRSTVFTKKHFHLPALLDTGTSIIFMPPQYLKAASKAFPGATYNKTHDLYYVPCELKTSNTIDFGFLAPDGDEFVMKIPVQRMVYKIPPSSTDAGTCIIGILGASDFIAPFSVLGDTFLNSVYTSFDQDDGAVYMAPLKNCGSEVVPVSKHTDVLEIEGKCPKRGSPKGCSTTSTSLAPKPTEPSFSTFSIKPTQTTSWFDPVCSADPCASALDADPSAFNFCSDFLPLFLPSAATIAVPTQYRSDCRSASQGLVPAVSSACICKLDKDAKTMTQATCKPDACLVYFYDPTYPDGMPYESTWCEEFLAVSTTRSSYLPYGYWCATNKHSMRSVSSACSCFLANPTIPAVASATTTSDWSIIWTATSTSSVNASVPTFSPATPSATVTSVPWTRNVTSTSSFTYTSGTETSTAENATASASASGTDTTSSALETATNATSPAVETGLNATSTALETGTDVTSSPLATGTGSSSGAPTTTDLGWNATTASASEAEGSTTTIYVTGSSTTTETLPANFTATVFPNGSTETGPEASSTAQTSFPLHGNTTALPTETDTVNPSSLPTGGEEGPTTTSDSAITIITGTAHPHHGHSTTGFTVTMHVTTRFPKGGDCMGGCNCRQRTVCHGSQYSTVFTASPTGVARLEQAKRRGQCTVVHICTPLAPFSDTVIGTLSGSGWEEPEPTETGWASELSRPRAG